MRTRRLWIAGLAVWALCFGGYADILSYTTSGEDGKTLLTSVTVQRGDGPAIFDAAKLIAARLTHFKTPTPRVVTVPAGSTPPAQGRRGNLLGVTLNDGLSNPGGQEADLKVSPILTGPDATPGLAVEFEEPVVNLPGDDVVFFDLQTSQGNPPAGDPVRVAPLQFREGLHSLTITAYDIQFGNPKAQALEAFDIYTMAEPPASLEAIENGALTRLAGGEGFKALAVGIDLSELGYQPNEQVTGLFFQNTLPSEPSVDPVCIAGLPLPQAPNVLAKEPMQEGDPACLMEEFLTSPAAAFDEIVFAARTPGDDHWYANFGYYAAPIPEYPPQRAPNGVVELPRIFKDGGRLCRLNLRSGQVAVLLDEPAGSVRDPQVRYDGNRIAFSYRKGGDPFFHLYEINPDGSGLKQLTDGPFNDIEPTYLPDGGIMFSSDRCWRWVNCHRTPVASLYRCEGDGSGIRMVSTNIEHDNTSWPLPDGRILYMRWEYVDRSQMDFHHLWTVNPDGTNHMIYYGNARPGFAMLDAKPIPGTKKVVVSFSPGHGQPEHTGKIVIVDPARGPDDERSARTISKGAPEFKDPYPLSEDYFLVARKRELLLMHKSGTVATLYTLPDDVPALHAHEPRPLVAHEREAVIPPRVDLAKTTGRLFLEDIYKGRNMDGVKRGEVASLLVMEQLPKPVNFSGGMWPTSNGGTFTLSRILGTVPVEPDGSAYMDLPAMRSFFFVALDKDGLSVKRMQSFLSVMPGETTGCVGCHERRVTTPLVGARRPVAMRRAPSAVTPIEGVPEVFDFHRDIQPILNAHCLPCHDAEKRSGGVDLSADHAPLFNQSYWSMMKYGLFADGRNEPYGNRAPRTIGSSASRLMEKIDGSHHDVQVTPHEHDLIRLWIESSAPYAGTYAALGTSLFPVAFPVEAMERRCGSCHGSVPKDPKPIGGQGMYFRFGGKGPYVPLVHEFLDLQQIRGRIGYYKFGDALPPQAICDLTKPEMSLVLRAPLAKEAGGLGLCEGTVFATRDDPDCQAILAAVQAAAQKHDTEKCFDMPGFRPNDYYIYQMQRYGVLPASLQPTDPVDGYAVDQAYWRMFWYKPKAGEVSQEPKMAPR